MACLPFLCGGSRSSFREKVEIDGGMTLEDSGTHKIKIYSYRELKHATDNFSDAHKIGEGGFGSVYKAKLRDGKLAAVKVLAAESRQGAKEFLTEIKVISDVGHDNLVELYGCCYDDDQRILVYSYCEKNSLAQTLLGGGFNKIHFSWKIRSKICIGIARGLAYLHEEVKPHIVHRDIKASNILLDKDLNAKISDFGLAKLLPPNTTHVSTRVAGTIGYLAPEYALRGQVTRKSDVYSFGVLLLEIVSGRSNTNTKLPPEDRFLLERTWVLHGRKELLAIVDTELEGEYDAEEACRFLKVGLLCTQDSLKLRPPMSKVVKLLTGERTIDTEITRPALISDFMNPKNTDELNSADTVSSSPYNSSLDATQASFPFTAILDRED